MLSNEMTEATKTGQVELKMGHPVYVMTKTPGVQALVEVLKGAKMEARLPLEVAAQLKADGKVEVSLLNEGGRSADVRVKVESPGLFQEAVEETLLDLSPKAVWAVEVPVAKAPAKGTEATVKVTIDAGLHGLRRSVREVRVKF